jgi:hypothetical protein
MTSAWEMNVDFKMFSHEEELATDPIVASWTRFSENVALGTQTYILEDGLELPRTRTGNTLSSLPLITLILI